MSQTRITGPRPPPAIVHDIVPVLKRIAASDPKRTILTVATAVAAAPGYAWEPDGAQAVLDLVNTTVAEHRDRILADRNGPALCDRSWKASSPRA
jgi:hypothetical protein